MQGKRLADGTDWSSDLLPGAYWKHAVGHWVGLTPNNLTCNLEKHSVVEHEDGTITVSPSILVNGGNQYTWHGFLEKGVWRSC